MLEIIINTTKFIFIAAGIIIFSACFFYTSETHKMERVLKIELPTTIRTLLSLQMILAMVFMGVTFLLLMV